MQENVNNFLDFLSFISTLPLAVFESEDEGEVCGRDAEVSFEDDMPFIPDPCPIACDECKDKCDDYYDYAEWTVPFVTKIIFSPPATIVFWMDGTKTIVRCSKNDRYDKYLGFAAAVVKKMFGSGSKVDRFINSVAVPDKTKKKD